MNFAPNSYESPLKWDNQSGKKYIKTFKKSTDKVEEWTYLRGEEGSKSAMNSYRFKTTPLKLPKRVFWFSAWLTIVSIVSSLVLAVFCPGDLVQR